MTKRKAAPRKPEVRTYPEVIGPLPVAVLRCIWSTKVVIPARRTISGKRYEFKPGEVKTIHVLDAPLLLSLERKQLPGCCGGVPNPASLKYFEEA